MAKNENRKKLDLGETKGVSGGFLYVFKRKSGEYGYYVPGCQYPFFSRDVARKSCNGTLTDELFCASEEVARARAEREWAIIQEKWQVKSPKVGFKNLVDDTIYDGFITGSGTSDLY